MGGAVEDSAGQVAKDAGPAAKRTKEVGHSVADDAAEGAEGARGKAKGKASELKGQVRPVACCHKRAGWLSLGTAGVQDCLLGSAACK